MTDLDYDVFAEGMAMLCVVANREPTDILLSTYYALLKDLTPEQFKSAVTNVLADRQYSNLPVPANIREAAIGKLDDEALIALAKLERAMSTWGAYRSIAFDDPVIHAFVAANGGWPFLCRMEGDQWKFKRIDFVKSYKAFAPNLNRLMIPLVLVGEDEHRNPALPVRMAYIGNREAIEMWQGGVRAMLDHERRTPAILAIADGVL
jgi:hypothetical protein